MKGFKSIYFKNCITIIGIIVTSFVILSIAFSMLSYRYVIDDKRSAMSFNAKEAVKVVSAYNLEWELDGLEVRMALTSMANTSGCDILLSNETGVVISCSDNRFNCGHIGKTLPETLIAYINGKGEYSGASDLNGLYQTVKYIVGLPVFSLVTGETVGYIFLSSGMADMSEMWRAFSTLFSFVTLAVIVIALIITMLTTKKQTEPINEMARAAHRFERGDFSARVKETGRKDEIGELSEAFNLMANSLERSENLRREFIANVSHELKTPMTTITGFADGILDGTIPPEKQEEYIRVISSESKRLARLVKSMLEMSQLQAMDASVLRKKSFDIAEVIRLTLLSLETKINDKTLDVDLQLPEEAMITRGDKDSITQVVYNLIDNAIKFADKGSVLQLSLWKQGGKAYVAVENTGTTIKEEELPLIFDRFHKSDKSRSMDREGVGLGLYIVKTILDNHNEDIYVTSQDGVTRFVFTLSLKQD